MWAYRSTVGAHCEGEDERSDSVDTDGEGSDDSSRSGDSDAEGSDGQSDLEED